MLEAELRHLPEDIDLRILAEEEEKFLAKQAVRGGDPDTDSGCYC